MSISIILPAYKEAENLRILLPKINNSLIKIGVPYEVLVIDTMEKVDDTEEICKHNHIKCIRREGGNTYGDAIKTGIKYAKMEYLVVMDADGSHNPDDISRFYNEMKAGDFDLIIGSRYTSGGNSSNNIILKLMSYMVNLVYRIIFRIKAKDVSDSFRMYQTNQLKEIDLSCDNFDLVEEILIRLIIKHQNFSLKEVPIYFNKRLYGESKRDLIKFILSYITTIRKMYMIRNEAIRMNKLYGNKETINRTNTDMAQITKVS